ncbi:MAG TPA: CusA/CzcA family heavy metal efflux RND transporter [Verrucomicrobiae bacterium]|nr:CusA/CzcA family heavy metal efflux RND transporter [Verrucomicrobiae bacterium]
MDEPAETKNSAARGDLERLLRAMIERSVRHRAAAIFIAAAILCLGAWSATRLRLDVTPDISNLQVQVLTSVPNLSPEEIESSVTRPIELEMFGLPGLEQVRSLTRFGISQVSLVFADGTDLFQARQTVAERLTHLTDKIPRGLSPQLAPPSSGLGEVFTYALAFKTNSPELENSTESRLRHLKLAQKFIVKPCLQSVKGVTEINTTGGYDQEMIVEVDPLKLPAIGMDLDDIATLVERDVAVGGGALVERNGNQFIIRSRSRAQTSNQLANVSIKLPWVLRAQPLSTVADIRIGSNIRLGAATLNGEETVLGTAMMLTGENARAVAKSFRKALTEAQSQLPADMELKPLYDRAELVDGVIQTVGHNLLIAAALVLAVLFSFLGNWRMSLVVATVLLLSFALGLGGMIAFGIMGSLLTLGAIDFGVVVDDAIVMVENVSRNLSTQNLSAHKAERFAAIVDACCQVRKPMLAGMLVIIGAYLPVLTLGGMEGRMFRPLAEAVILVLSGSLLLTVTLVPALCAVALDSGVGLREPQFIKTLRATYVRLLEKCRARWKIFFAASFILMTGGVFLATRLGANFLPALDEGWLVVEVQRDPQISLMKSVEMECRTEAAIRAAVPEVKDLFSRIGMSEIATDPQGANQNDIYISFRPRTAWRKVNGRVISKGQLAEAIRSAIQQGVPGQDLELNQPIAVRFDELLEGVRTDLAIKVFGPDLDQLDSLAGKVAEAVKKVPDAGEVVVDRPGRTAMQEFTPDPVPAVRFMIAGDVMNNAVSIGLAGREVGRIDENNCFYPVIVRLAESARTNPATLALLPVRSADSSYVAKLSDVGQWTNRETAVSTITREQAQRREAVMVTVNSSDVVGFVERARAAVQKQVVLPAGCRLEFSGAYKNWQSGGRRLFLSGMVFIILGLALVYATFKSWRQTGLIACGMPFAVMGGIYGLWFRHLPVTMPAAVGFVTLAGLSLLNGMVLVTCFNDLCAQGMKPALAGLNAAKTRLRPVLMTALVAGVGFIPMAVSTEPGAELQKPFVTVVIFGILTSTVFTLVIVPLCLGGRDKFKDG